MTSPGDGLRGPAPHPSRSVSNCMLGINLRNLEAISCGPIRPRDGIRTDPDPIDAAETGDLLVQRVIRSGGHCTFTRAEVQQAWHDLVAWVEDGTVPEGDDLSDLETAGLNFTLPLRDGDPLGN